MLRHTFCVSILLGMFVTISVVLAQEQGQDKTKSLPEGKGRDYVASVCQQCHGLEAITGSQRSLEEWRNVVGDMVSNGAALQEDEVEIVAQYLAKNFGPEKTETKEEKASSSQPKVNVNKSSAKDLETDLQLSEKDAKAIVEYREKHGKFSNVDDLKKVAGLDTKKIDDAKDRLEF